MNKPDTRVTKHQKARQLASIIPYRKQDGRWFFYLQRRDGNAKLSPGFLGLFGGGMEEGETPEEAMLRETQEELCITPKDYWFFWTYRFFFKVVHVYAIEVGADFEQTVTVCEGEYGRFFSMEEIEKEPLMLAWVLEILKELAHHLKDQ